MNKPLNYHRLSVWVQNSESCSGIYYSSGRKLVYTTKASPPDIRKKKKREKLTNVEDTVLYSIKVKVAKNLSALNIKFSIGL